MNKKLNLKELNAGQKEVLLRREMECTLRRKGKNRNEH